MPKPRKRIEVYPTRGGFGWRAKAGNNRIVGRHDEAMTEEAAAIRKATAQFPDRPVFVTRDGELVRTSR